MKVGDTIWKFNENRLVYTKVPGSPFGGKLIRREQWEPRTIVGETSRSWLVARWERDTQPTKVPKKGYKGYRGWAFTQREVELDVFIEGLRGDLHHRFQCALYQDQEMALKIARLLGFEIPSVLEEPS